MGNSCSSTGKQTKGSSKEPTLTYLEVKLKALVKEYAQTSNLSSNSITRIFLSFPKVEKAMNMAKKHFKVADQDNDGVLSPAELKSLLEEMGFMFGEKGLQELLETTDFDNNDKIDFKEFVVALTIACFLKKNEADDKSPTTPRKSEIIDALMTVVNAFVIFDLDRDAVISRNEVTQVLGSVTPGPNRSDDAIAKKRFQEMDWDGDGNITFKEFLYSFTSWVGVDDEDDDE